MRIRRLRWTTWRSQFRSMTRLPAHLTKERSMCVKLLRNLLIHKNSTFVRHLTTDHAP
ncbi:hypothetical protein M758_UG062800 [Ceratodon purpureus]|nr:hypothetical protein M758_UG062800 [Ceratodon purpureus]